MGPFGGILAIGAIWPILSIYLTPGGFLLMLFGQRDLSTPRHRLAFCWRTMLAGYRLANLASHQVLGWIIRLVVLVYFFFAVVFLVLRYLILPNIDHYKPEIEQLSSRALGSPVSIARVYASWQGLRPSLFLGDVLILDRDGRSALSLPSVSATLSWWSVFGAGLRFENLELGRPDLDIRRAQDGKLTVGGLLIDTHGKSDGSGLDWLLSQREIVIRDGRLRWNDEMRNAPELSLSGLTVVLQNNWRHHRAALVATPPQHLAEPIDVRLDFVHPAFARKISDVRQWKGELYADVRSTDLALWQQYLPYPVEVQQGSGAVRAWLSFDRAKLADFTADLRLTDAAVRLATGLPVLELVQVEGRISARETYDAARSDGKPSFGSHGHQIQLRHFSLLTKDGLQMKDATIEEVFTPAGRGGAESAELRADALDLRTLAGLAERLPLSPASRQALADFEPQGSVRHFSARWQGAYPKLQAYQLKGEFLGLAMKAQPARSSVGKNGKPVQIPAIPGFQNLSGSIDASEVGGHVKLASDGFRLQLDGYFAEPQLVFEQLTFDGGWQFLDSDLLLDVKQMHIVSEGITADITGQHTLPLKARPKGVSPLGICNLNANVSGFDVTRIGRYLPLQTNPGLRRWLTGALGQGMADDVTLTLKGDLQYFPFRVEAGRDKKSDKKGEFRIAGKIRQGRLNYLPGVFGKDGKAPLWPELEQIEGRFLFERTRMEIVADSAKTNNVNLNAVSAIIPDLLSKDAVLEIEGQASGQLNDMVRYVNASPVLDWIGNITEETHATGAAKLALKFKMPFAHTLDTKLQGSVQLLGNDVALMNYLPTFAQTVGKLEFTERNFNLAGVGGQFVGGPITLQGGVTRENGVQIKASGIVTADGLRRAWPQAGMQRLADHVQGGTRFAAALSIKKRLSELTIDSSLQGLGLSFPAPLRKVPTENLPFRLQLTGQNTDEAILRDELKINLGPGMRARFVRQKPNQKGAAWRVVKGGVGINDVMPDPESGLHLNVNMRSLSVDAWRALAGSVASAAGNAGGSVAAGNAAAGNVVGNAAAGNASANAAAGNAGDADGSERSVLAQYVDPDSMSARASELFILGKKFDNVVVGASLQKGLWQANLDSTQASGYLSWSHNGGTLGKVTGRLAQLIVPESVANDVSDILEGKNEAFTIPALDVVAENFELFGKKLGRLELDAENVRREWRINRLLLVNPDAELKASGKWITREGQTQLNYALAIVDAGKMLERFGFANVLRGGKGKVEGDLNWKGLPFALDIPSLSGQLTMNIAAGQFLKVEPGAAKLLGVLSLQALPRLLKLDFRDVFSEGFAFDAITAQASIRQGVLATENLKMRGVNATVLMDGEANINKETQKLHVVVIPDFNVGTASVVYALAVNPVIGLGSFLAQLFLKNPVMKAFTFQYQITGSWKEPMVSKIDPKPEPAAHATGGG
jgi:uncharacterized protein (TIGR02099 family)